MNAVFIGGSRHVSRLPAEVKERLDNVIGRGHRVIVGDAAGADKAVQKHLHDAAYDKVVVFCSGDHYRNNLGQWDTRYVHPPKNAKGFQFYAAKDREMAREADFGLMIWDGKSPGTLLNVLRLVQAGKKAVLFNVPDKQAIEIKTTTDWDGFLARCTAELRDDLKERATPGEWRNESGLTQASLLDTLPVAENAETAPPARPMEDIAAALNTALARGDISSALDMVGHIARAQGMGHVARESGLARESLYRSLGPGGNPEFATIIKVLGSVGLRLAVSRDEKRPQIS